MGVKIRQKEKGRGKPWWVFVSHLGKRKSMKIGDKRSAEKVAAAVRRKLAKGQFDLEPKKKMPTFGEYSKKWIDGYVNIHLRESTQDGYTGILENHVLPVFKNQKIDAISRGDLRDFLLSKFTSGLSIDRVKSIKDIFSGVFNYALDEELIKVNPTTGITKRLFPKNGHGKREIGQDDFFTEKELDSFLTTCETDFPEYYLFFLMAARTGARMGELLAVQWGDVDLKNNFIWFKRSYRRGRFTAPKNGKSRKVDMSNYLAEVLRGALKQGFQDVTGLVHRKNGRVMEQNYIRSVYARILKKAKVRYLKFHGLRHTFCAHLLSNDVSPYYVSKQAGHSSIKITCDIYGSWISTEENRHVNLLDKNAKVVHQNAPQAHPVENVKAKAVDIAVNYS
jgi:integrase